jgi:hypothetical protein
MKAVTRSTKRARRTGRAVATPRRRISREQERRALVDELRREILLLEQDAAKSHTHLAGSLSDIEASRTMLERHRRDEEAWARR